LQPARLAVQRLGGRHRRPTFEIVALLDHAGLAAAKRRFREIFPGGFADETYLEWERAYKWEAHQRAGELLGLRAMKALLGEGRTTEIGRRAVEIYQKSKLNLLALYEWMALREALVDPAGAARFAPALYALVHGRGAFGPRFERFVAALDEMPQRQTRIAKWPVVTLFPFLAHPEQHLILKPNLMKRAALRFGADLRYASRPNLETYEATLRFARGLATALATWRPRDMIDIQGFIWVTHSDEYADWPWED
jgi:hypothetical protein